MRLKIVIFTTLLVAAAGAAAQKHETTDFESCQAAQEAVKNGPPGGIRIGRGQNIFPDKNCTSERGGNTSNKQVREINGEKCQVGWGCFRVYYGN